MERKGRDWEQELARDRSFLKMEQLIVALHGWIVWVSVLRRKEGEPDRVTIT